MFCNTREAVRHLHATLLERGFAAVPLSGELSQNERNHAMQALRDGRARVCVATDVAARGIDLPDLGLVIHADLPHDVETLQHRSGRTGRAGRKGVSALLVPPSRAARAEQLFARRRHRAALERPADRPRKSASSTPERLLADPLLTEAPTEEDLAMARSLLASAARKRSPRRWCGSTARACRRSRRSPTPATSREPRASRERAAPARERRRSRAERKARGPGRAHAFGPPARRHGSASTSDARKTPIRNGCCR